MRVIDTLALAILLLATAAAHQWLKIIRLMRRLP